MDNKFDVAIIGSGLGGLECALMLSKEGRKVCVLEQSAVFGGCLQSFERRARTIDTGIHYIGSMDEGQIMRQYFTYFGIFDSLDIVKLNDRFDTITLGGKGSYGYHHGYDRFSASLAELFPTQKQGIERYCDRIRQIGSSIDVSVHRSGMFRRGGVDDLGVSAVEFINSCVTDPLLANILAGTNVLYGGTRHSANLYHHAMINHSNIEGAYRFVGGTQRIAELLVAKIVGNGGVVANRSKVVSIDVEQGDVKSVELENGEKIFADHFISDIHPASTFALVGQNAAIKKGYRSRLNSLPNTPSLFSVYLIMKPDSFPYINENHYLFRSDNVWDTMIDKESWTPKMVMLSTQLAKQNAKHSDVVTLLSPVDGSLFDQWQQSRPGQRGSQYDQIKSRITDNIVAQAALFFPQIRDSIEATYSASPLSYAHHTGTPQGSAYGIVKDCRTAMATLLPTRTKLHNLLLTGQNLNVHGALGVTLSSAVTCAEFLGEEYLAKKIATC